MGSGSVGKLDKDVHKLYCMRKFFIEGYFITSGHVIKKPVNPMEVLY